MKLTIERIFGGGNRRIDIDLNSLDISIEEFKNLIANKFSDFEGRLIFAGKELNHGNLSEFSIQKETLLYWVPKIQMENLTSENPSSKYNSQELSTQPISTTPHSPLLNIQHSISSQQNSIVSNPQTISKEENSSLSSDQSNSNRKPIDLNFDEIEIDNQQMNKVIELVNSLINAIQSNIKVTEHIYRVESFSKITNNLQRPKEQLESSLNPPIGANFAAVKKVLLDGSKNLNTWKPLIETFANQLDLIDQTFDCRSADTNSRLISSITEIFKVIQSACKADCLDELLQVPQQNLINLQERLRIAYDRYNHATLDLTEATDAVIQVSEIAMSSCQRCNQALADNEMKNNYFSISKEELFDGISTARNDFLFDSNLCQNDLKQLQSNMQKIQNEYSTNKNQIENDQKSLKNKMEIELERQSKLKQIIIQCSIQLVDSFEKYTDAKQLFEGSIDCNQQINSELQSITLEYDQILNWLHLRLQIVEKTLKALDQLETATNQLKSGIDLVFQERRQRHYLYSLQILLQSYDYFCSYYRIAHSERAGHKLSAMELKFELDRDTKAKETARLLRRPADIKKYEDRIQENGIVFKISNEAFEKFDLILKRLDEMYSDIYLRFREAVYSLGYSFTEKDKVIKAILSDGKEFELKELKYDLDIQQEQQFREYFERKAAEQTLMAASYTQMATQTQFLLSNNPTN